MAGAQTLAAEGYRESIAQAKPEFACQVPSERAGPVTPRDTIARLRERIAALTTAGFPVREVVVWRNPGETETEAIERYVRQHLDIATTPRATLAFHVVSWKGPAES
jgi:hypothetical protein